MTRSYSLCLFTLWLSLCAIAGIVPRQSAANEPAIDGYQSYEQLRRALESLAADPAATLQSLGTTLGGREIYVLTLSRGDAQNKPAILVVGSVHAPHLVGSELAVRMAEQILEGAEADENLRRLLEEQTLYILPRPAPDASEAFFHRPYWERSVNARATDDDRDGRMNEDGPEDLNGDGQITMMRIEDPTGHYLPHPDDARVLIEADAKQGEQGRYRVATEGIDNDQDELQGEDGPGGVAFDRNFTFEYPYFEPGAGPHQVSEPETRAVADFAFDHPNIYLVFSFSPHDNLLHPWKAERQDGRIPKSVHADDAPYLEHIAQKYQEALAAKDPPESPGENGSFVHWAYYHFGRWSLGARAWWVPQATDDSKQLDDQEKSPATEEPADEEADRDTTEAPNRKRDDDRGADDVNALKYFHEKGVNAFAQWKSFDHPDYPGRRVEVGGFYPYVRLNPPQQELDRLAKLHTGFLVDLAGLRPKLAVAIQKIDDLGGGVFRVTAQVRNDGYLPTASAMGDRARTLQRLEMRIELPPSAALVTGVARVPVETLAGRGDAMEHAWLLRVDNEQAEKSIKVIVGSPTTGTAQATQDLP